MVCMVCMVCMYGMVCMVSMHKSIKGEFRRRQMTDWGPCNKVCLDY